MSNTDQLDIGFLKLQVEHGGGEWVGVQEGFGDVEAKVLFNEAKRAGQARRLPATMALAVSQVTVERIHDHIAATNRKFALGRIFETVREMQEKGHKCDPVGDDCTVCNVIRSVTAYKKSLKQSS
jgi:hypothetical protein